MYPISKNTVYLALTYSLYIYICIWVNNFGPEYILYLGYMDPYGPRALDYPSHYITPSTLSPKPGNLNPDTTKPKTLNPKFEPYPHDP